MKRRYRRYLWPLYRERLRHSKLPILVGPWHGELGFEALYWLPWLAQMRHELGIDPARIIPIARGGTAQLYEAPQGLELYAMRSPQDVRIEHRLQFAKRAMLKQMHWTPFDRQIVQDAAQTLGLKHYLTLHPSWMYQRLAPFWDGQQGIQWLQPQLRYASWEPPPLPGGLTLPENFVAVRFYVRPTFPDSQETREISLEAIKQLATAQPVVLLSPGLHTDDHWDLLPQKPIPNVFRLKDLCPMLPETNLIVQAAVLARASGFIGTYGGLSQLALRFGKPVIGMYTEWGGTAWPHRHLSEVLAAHMGVTFQVQRLKDLPLIQNALPKVLFQQR